jgi:hypothetical protein
VNDQYRVTLRWASGYVYEVRVEDYSIHERASVGKPASELPTREGWLSDSMRSRRSAQRDLSAVARRVEAEGGRPPVPEIAPHSRTTIWRRADPYEEKRFVGLCQRLPRKGSKCTAPTFGQT